MGDETSFKILFFSAHILGNVLCISCAVWLVNFRGGLGFRTGDPGQQFNYHIIMGVSMVYICASAILTFRGLRKMSKGTLRVIHAVTGLVSLVFGVVALFSVYDALNYNTTYSNNLVSVHSWLGVMAFVLFFSQWIFSFLTYLCPKFKVSIRVGFLPFHVFFGLVIFVLLVAVTELGLAQIITKTNDLEGLLMKSTGILMVVFAALVVYITVKKNYKRTSIRKEKNWS